MTKPMTVALVALLTVPTAIYAQSVADIRELHSPASLKAAVGV
jgi:hypothetical protein